MAARDLVKSGKHKRRVSDDQFCVALIAPGALRTRRRIVAFDAFKIEVRDHGLRQRQIVLNQQGMHCHALIFLIRNYGDG